MVMIMLMMMRRRSRKREGKQKVNCVPKTVDNSNCLALAARGLCISDDSIYRVPYTVVVAVLVVDRLMLARDRLADPARIIMKESVSTSDQVLGHFFLHQTEDC